MPLFRVQTYDGVREIDATRAVMKGADVVFESLTPTTGWQAQARVPVDTIEKITRRVNEPSGAIGWITDRPLTRAVVDH